MTTHKEALKLALEALERGETELRWKAITAIKEALAQPEQDKERCVGCEACIDTACGRDECPKGWPKAAQPEQEQNLKLMPREATPEMLKAMDECSTEGYDERLYEGHAGSVYMAAWDAFYGQHCYCGDITNLGVIHRDDGPRHYPDHKEPEQEPVAKYTGETWCGSVVNLYEDIPLDTLLYTTPPQRKQLTDDEAFKLIEQDYQMEEYAQAALQLIRRTEAAHGIKE